MFDRNATKRSAGCMRLAETTGIYDDDAVFYSCISDVSVTVKNGDAVILKRKKV